MVVAVEGHAHLTLGLAEEPEPRLRRRRPVRQVLRHEAARRLRDVLPRKCHRTAFVALQRVAKEMGATLFLPRTCPQLSAISGHVRSSVLGIIGGRDQHSHCRAPAACRRPAAPSLRPRPRRARRRRGSATPTTHAAFRLRPLRRSGSGALWHRSGRPPAMPRSCNAACARRSPTRWRPAPASGPGSSCRARPRAAR